MNEIERKLTAKLAGRRSRHGNAADFFQAAVLAPLVEVKGEMHLLFEVRSERLAWQPGEICFPGGRIEADDLNPARAAVRETMEELGLKRSAIRVIGALDYIISPNRVKLHPVLAMCTDLAMIELNKAEVEEVFTVPMASFLNAAPRVGKMRLTTEPDEAFPYDLLPSYAGISRPYEVLFYTCGPRVIWGMTAKVVECLLPLYRSVIEKRV